MTRGAVAGVAVARGKRDLSQTFTGVRSLVLRQAFFKSPLAPGSRCSVRIEIDLLDCFPTRVKVPPERP